MSWNPGGTVHRTLLNFRGESQALTPQMAYTLWKSPPKSHALSVKAANTSSEHGAAIAVPARRSEIEIGAPFALVIGDKGPVAGDLLMNNLSMPHASHADDRPFGRFKCHFI